MATETIYEGVGEVISIENGSKSADIEVDEGTSDHEHVNVQLFSHGMTDDAVVSCIFNSCDMHKSGLVKVSILVDFLLNTCDNTETRETFEDLLAFLDPTYTDPLISTETFRSMLKAWVAKVHSRTPSSDDADSETSQMKMESNKSSGSRDSSFSEGFPYCNLDVKELQFQFNRLQEENKLLHEQMVDVEETNLSLRSENKRLKSKINQVELEVSEMGEQSKLLQEDNGQLQRRMQEMKDELQTMTKHYNDCRGELEEKYREMDLNNSREEEYTKHLADTIKQLEELLLVKEEELRKKDQEIQRIGVDLMEQQLKLDTPNECDSRGREYGECSLAAELQSSACGTPWKKGTETSTKPDFIHHPAWDVMLNEPEYEDEPVQHSVLLGQSEKRTSAGKFDQSTDGQAEDQVDAVPFLREADFMACRVRTSTTKLLHGAQSTPLSTPRNPASPINWNAEGDVTDVSLKTPSGGSFPKKLLTGSLLLVCILAVTFVLVCVTGLGLLYASSVSSPDGTYSSSYHYSSVWPKMLEVLKPFCTIEYRGYPPV